MKRHFKQTTPWLLSVLSALPSSAFAPPSPNSTTERTRPNILLIVADDLGYGDLSIQGCKDFSTPHIDNLFHQGIRFTQAYVSNTVCAPSRAGLITGRMGSNFGFEANLPAKAKQPGSTIGLDPKQKTMGDLLKQAGYQTYLVGKWHLGHNDQLFHPNKRGFDQFLGFTGGARDYWPLKKIDHGKSLQHNGIFIEEPHNFYITDYLTEQATEFIAKQTKEQPEQPFFMFLSYTAPHHPMHAKESDLARVQHIPTTDHPRGDWRRIYAAMMLNLDDNIGRLLRFLDKQQLTENTLIVFLSDNGGPLEKNGSNNGNLRGAKGSLWEGGMRVPYAMQWKGTIPAEQVSAQQVSSLDLLPTFMAISGADRNIHFETDGVDLTPIITNQVQQLNQRPFLWRRNYTDDLCLRRGAYKYVKTRGNNKEYLFDVEQDPSELRNLARELPEILDSMRREFATWEATIPAPAFNSDWRDLQKQRSDQNQVR